MNSKARIPSKRARAQSRNYYIGQALKTAIQQAKPIDPNGRTCSRCGAVGDFHKFSKICGYFICQDCVKISRRRTKFKALHKKYGLTESDYQEMVRAQASACKICGAVPQRGLFIDHDHKTGKVRGLLCSTCNLGLGSFKDDPKVLRSAITYLMEISNVATKTS